MLSCKRCERILPEADFKVKDKDGRLSRVCRECEARYDREWRKRQKVKAGNWLFLGCTHLPYQHADLLDWLEALQARFTFRRLIHLGDLYDWGNVSRHGYNPNMPSPLDEYNSTIPLRERLYRMFPSADMVAGNHDLRYLVKAAEAGIPDIVIKGIREAMGLPEGWVEHGTSVELSHPTLGPILCVHGDKIPKKAGNNAKSCAKHFVMADRHTQASVEWVSALMGKQLFGMSTGCGIDESQLAFKYSKKFIPRPVISVGAIIDNLPVVIPMHLDSDHRWTGAI